MHQGEMHSKLCSLSNLRANSNCTRALRQKSSCGRDFEARIFMKNLHNKSSQMRAGTYTYSTFFFISKKIYLPKLAQTTYTDCNAIWEAQFEKYRKIQCATCANISQTRYGSRAKFRSTLIQSVSKKNNATREVRKITARHIVRSDFDNARREKYQRQCLHKSSTGCPAILHLSTSDIFIVSRVTTYAGRLITATAEAVGPF